MSIGRIICSAHGHPALDDVSSGDRIATPTVAVIAASFAGYIAWRQAKTARSKLNFDLFEKRWKVYIGTQKLIGRIVVASSWDHDDLQDFLNATHGAQWLFDDTLGEYLKEVYERALELKDLNASVAIEYPGEERVELRQKRLKVKSWFNNQLNLIDDRFKPFMVIEPRAMRRRGLKRDRQPR